MHDTSLAWVMRHVLVIVCGVLIAFGGVAAAIASPFPEAAAPAGGPPTYVASNRTLVSGGVARSYILAVPLPYPDEPLPLVIALHGHGWDVGNFRPWFGLEGGAAGGAVFAYPQSNGEFFDPSEAGRMAEAEFSTALIASIGAERSIDHTRVYLVGHSSGAIMGQCVGLSTRTIGGARRRAAFGAPFGQRRLQLPAGRRLPRTWGADHLGRTGQHHFDQRRLLDGHRLRRKTAVRHIHCAGGMGSDAMRSSRRLQPPGQPPLDQRPRSLDLATGATRDLDLDRRG